MVKAPLWTNQRGIAPPAGCWRRCLLNANVCCDAWLGDYTVTWLGGYEKDRNEIQQDKTAIIFEIWIKKCEVFRNATRLFSP